MASLVRELIERAKAIPVTFVEWLGLSTTSDVGVTDKTYPDAYAINPWVFACVKVIARNGATVPIKVFRVKGASDTKRGKAADEAVRAPNRAGYWYGRWKAEQAGSQHMRRIQLEEVEDSGLGDLLAYVSPLEDYYTLQQATISWLALHGNAYWYPIKAGNNELPSVLQWLPSDKVTPELKGGKLTYEYDEGSGKKKVFKQDELVHIKMFSAHNPYLGQSPIRPIEDIVNAYTQVMRYNHLYFKQGGIPPALLYGKARMTQKQREEMREMWTEWRGESKSAGMPLFLGSDLKFEDVGKSPDEVTCINFPKFLRETICAALDVPPGAVGIMEFANYANLKEQRSLLWRNAIIPYMAQEESAINSQLVPIFGDNLVALFDLSQVEGLQPDQDAVAERAQKLVTPGILTINELRQDLLNKDPVPWGDTWWGPFSTTPLASIDTEPPEPGTEAETPSAEEKFTRATSDEPTIRRLEQHQREALYKAFNLDRDEYIKALHGQVAAWYKNLGAEMVKKIEADSSLAKANHHKAPRVESLLFDLDDAGENLVGITASATEAVYAEAGAATVGRLGLGIVFDPDTTIQQNLLRARKLEMKSVTKRAQKRVRETLAEGLAEGENVRDLTARVEEWTRVGQNHYAKVTARTEVGTAMNTAAFDAYGQAGATHKEWLSIVDDRTRTDEFNHLSADGETVKLKEPFVQTGEPLMYPQDPSGSAANVIQCRCTIAPVFEKEGPTSG